MGGDRPMIYRVSVDVERYQTLVPKDERIWTSSQLVFDGRRKLDWIPCETYVLNPLRTRGNFFHLCPGALVFDETAYSALDESLERSGEILPITTEGGGGQLYVLNVTECVNALDHAKAEWAYSTDGERKLGLKRYAFHLNRLPDSSLFKIPETARGDVLVQSRALEEGFLEVYRSKELRGLVFGQILEDE
jgi:hypothetical protein